MPASSAELLARALGRLDGALAVFGDADSWSPCCVGQRPWHPANRRQPGIPDRLAGCRGRALTVTGPAGDAAEFAGTCPTWRPAAEDALRSAAWLLEVHGELVRQLGHPGVGWRAAPLWIGASGATRAEARHVRRRPSSSLFDARLGTIMDKWRISEPWMKLSGVWPPWKPSTRLPKPTPASRGCGCSTR